MEKIAGLVARLPLDVAAAARLLIRVHRLACENGIERGTLTTQPFLAALIPVEA